jgi:hypothetical protein
VGRDSHSGGISDNAGFWSLNGAYGLRVGNRFVGSSLMKDSNNAALPSGLSHTGIRKR